MDTDQPYGDPNIGWVGVGNENRTGAIEYMAKSAIEDLLMDTVGRSSGQGTGDNYNSVTVRDNSVDVVLMNPPYSRTRVGQSAFDIAGLTEKERKACQARWAKLIKGEPCLKTAGMAATFLCVARKKVKPGGRIGFVLPRTAAFANSWERTRGMVERDFEDITAVAVSSGKALGRAAFSADTNMEEMLLTAARKRTADRDTLPGKVRHVVRAGHAAGGGRRGGAGYIGARGRARSFWATRSAYPGRSAARGGPPVELRGGGARRRGRHLHKPGRRRAAGPGGGGSGDHTDGAP